MQIRYAVADFNSVDLPSARYDLVCFHQSLHHVLALERLLGQVRRSLRAGGLLYLDEFIGPSRTLWNEHTIRWHRALYHCLARDIRHSDELAIPIQHEDASEAIRSSEIYSRLVIGFSIEHFRGYGGNLLAVLIPNLVFESLTDELVHAIIEAEQSLLAVGIPHFYAVIVARPKVGAAAHLADLRYYVEQRFPQLTVPVRSFIRRLRGRQQSYV